MLQNQWVDLRGLRCPEPVMVLHGVFRQLSGGDRVKVIATDPTTQHDIPRFCQNLCHILHEQTPIDSLPKSFIDSEFFQSKDADGNKSLKPGYYYFEIEKG